MDLFNQIRSIVTPREPNTVKTERVALERELNKTNYTDKAGRVLEKLYETWRNKKQRTKVSFVAREGVQKGLQMSVENVFET